MKYRLSTLLICCLPLCLAAQIRITGTVVEEFNEPLIGGTVYVKGTSYYTVTEFDGTFVLEVDSLPVVLVFSYTGFPNVELEVLSTNEPLFIEMKEEMIISCPPTIYYLHPHFTDNQFRNDMRSIAEPLYGLGLNGLLSGYENRTLSPSFTQRGIGYNIGNPLSLESTPPGQLALIRPEWGFVPFNSTGFHSSSPLSGKDVDGASLTPDEVETWAHNYDSHWGKNFSRIRMEGGSYGTAGGSFDSYFSEPKLGVSYNYLHSEGHRPHGRSNRHSLSLRQRFPKRDVYLQLYYHRADRQDPGPLTIQDFTEDPAAANPAWEDADARQTDDIALLSVKHDKKGNRFRLTANYAHREKSSPFWGDDLHDAGILLEDGYSFKKAWLPDIGGKVYYGNTVNFPSEQFVGTPDGSRASLQIKRWHYSHYLRYVVERSGVKAHFSLLGMGERWAFDDEGYSGYFTGEMRMPYDLYPKLHISYSRERAGWEWLFAVDVSKGQHFPREFRLMYHPPENHPLPEKSWTDNLTLGFRSPQELSFSATGYFIHGKQPIMESLSWFGFSRWRNADTVWRSGLELALRKEDTFDVPGWNFDFGYHLNKGIIKNMGTAYDLAGFPEHKFLSKMKYGIPLGDHGADVIFSYNYLSPFHAKYFIDGELPARHLLNARVNFRFDTSYGSRLRLFAGANNLLNRRYVEGTEGLGHGPDAFWHEAYIYPSAGMYIYGGVDFSINY